MKILICDDEKHYLDNLKQHVQEYMDQRGIESAIDAYTDPSEIMEGSCIYDVAFLDIQMEGIDGITLAKELKRRNGKLALFFVTNYEEYQDDAMDLQAFRFFGKCNTVNSFHLNIQEGNIVDATTLHNFRWKELTVLHLPKN